MPVMSPATCKAAIAALLNTIPNIGRVHDRRRIMRTEADVKAILYDSGLARLQGAFISMATGNTTVTERNPGHVGIGVKGGGNVITTMQFQIELFMAVNDADASETAFTTLAWQVADEFNAYGIIPGVTGAHLQLPADVEQFGYIVVAGFAHCHYARVEVGFTGRTRPA